NPPDNHPPRRLQSPATIPAAADHPQGRAYRSRPARTAETIVFIAAASGGLPGSGTTLGKRCDPRYRFVDVLERVCIGAPHITRTARAECIPGDDGHLLLGQQRLCKVL